MKHGADRAARVGAAVVNRPQFLESFGQKATPNVVVQVAPRSGSGKQTLQGYLVHKTPPS